MAITVVDPFPSDDIHYRFPDNQTIQAEPEFVDIIDVMLKSLLPGSSISTIYLCIASNSRLYLMTPILGLGIERDVLEK